jgi:hypothetical protein
MELNLGSYIHPEPWMWNVDCKPWDGVDEIVDLEKLPWPWRDGMWGHVRAIDILEHLGGIPKKKVVEELARITHEGGTVEIRVPCCTRTTALASLQHAHSFYFNSFDFSYAQPWFQVKSIHAELFRWHAKIEYKKGTRFILRSLASMGLVRGIHFNLVRIL